jgi:hypothetical protein
VKNYQFRYEFLDKAKMKTLLTTPVAGLQFRETFPSIIVNLSDCKLASVHPAIISISISTTATSPMPGACCPLIASICVETKLSVRDPGACIHPWSLLYLSSGNWQSPRMRLSRILAAANLRTFVIAVGFLTV